GDLVVGDAVVTGEGDGAEVELLAPGDRPTGRRVGRVGRGAEPGGAGGGGDDIGKQFDVGTVWGWDDVVGVVGVDAVEADQHVEVDHSACLVFGDLGVADADGG